MGYISNKRNNGSAGSSHSTNPIRSTEAGGGTSNVSSRVGGKFIFISACCLVLLLTTVAIVYEAKRILSEDSGHWLPVEVTDDTGPLADSGNLKNLAYDLQSLATGGVFPSSNEYFLGSSLYYDETGSGGGSGAGSGSGNGILNNIAGLGMGVDSVAVIGDVKRRRKRETIEYDEMGNRVYNVGVLMASHLGMYEHGIISKIRLSNLL